MEKKADEMCNGEGNQKFQDAVCEEMDDKESCARWAEAMQEKCKLGWSCRIDLMGDRGRCNGAFTAKLMSIHKEDEVELMEDLESSASIGDCFQGTLDDAVSCKADSTSKIEDMLDGVNVPSEELI